MVVNDPIADFITRIRNAAMARLDKCEIPGSKTKERVAAVLKKEGFIADWGRIDDNRQGIITVYLRYARDRASAIDGIRRRSRPGRRVYVSYADIPKVRSWLGVSILSTSRGVMTDKDARRLKVGGELLCEVW